MNNVGETISLRFLWGNPFYYISLCHCQQKQDKDQQSPKRDLIYADLAITETTGRIAQPAADTKPSTDYATVQIQPQTD